MKREKERRGQGEEGEGEKREGWRERKERSGCSISLLCHGKPAT